MKRGITGTLLAFFTTPSASPGQVKPHDNPEIAHLLSRTTFGARPGDIERAADIGVEKFIDQQLHPEQIDDSPTSSRLDPFQTLRMSSADLLREFPQGQGRPQAILRDLTGQKIVRAVHSNRQLLEVMTDFWFNHFNVFWGKGNNRWLVTDFEMKAIRPNVFGKFKDLLMATAKSPSMLFYLDNVQSTSPDPRMLERLRPNARRKPGINENYARELMELHTLGVDGGYSQQDVQEVARAFTGWSIARPENEFMFRPMLHDRGDKAVLGSRIRGSGIEDGEQVLDILSKHPSTAHFIATKLVRRFVADSPPESLVKQAAATFKRTGGDIREVLRGIFLSAEFSSREALGAKTKSPLELAISAIRKLNGTTNGSPALNQAISRMGQPLYLCQPPTGYPDEGDQWINTGSLLERINFGIALTAGAVAGTQVELGEFQNARAAALHLGSPEFQKR